MDLEGYTLYRIRLSERELMGFYYGFANQALWPLCHYFLSRVRYLKDHWQAYQAVNRKFAEKVIEIYQPGDLIWVQDYQLALVPQLLRQALPGARIGVFWHIPWPSSELFRTLPWARELLQGLLGADLIGFHTKEYVRHFHSCCRILLNLEEPLRVDGRRVYAEAHPIGVETEVFARLAKDPAVRAAAQALRRDVGARILLGVDRLDYTKGIPERLEAFGGYLKDHPEVVGQVKLIQIAVPSRERVDAYRQLRERVEGLVGRINGTYSRPGSIPIQFLSRSFSREELAAYYLAADVMLVTPLRDGLNLVAKEFAATSRAGVLLLSEFAGAAEELKEALLVNPYDHEGLIATIRRALEMPPRERIRRLQRLRERLRANDLSTWGTRFVERLEALGGT